MYTYRSIIGNIRLIFLIILDSLNILKYIPYYADPFVVGLAKTDDISHVTNRDDVGRHEWADTGLILGGDWDKNTREFVESSEWYSVLHKRFVEGLGWKEIPAIQERIEQVQQGKTVMDGRTTVDGVFKRCELMDEIYTDIKANGYKTQPELLKEGRGTPYSHYLPFKHKYHEVVVDISRDGELLFVDGHHRLSMAKILGIEQLPVRISVRHKLFVGRGGDVDLSPIDADYGHPFLPLRFQKYRS